MDGAHSGIVVSIAVPGSAHIFEKRGGKSQQIGNKMHAMHF